MSISSSPKPLSPTSSRTSLHSKKKKKKIKDDKQVKNKKIIQEKGHNEHSWYSFIFFLSIIIAISSIIIYKKQSIDIIDPLTVDTLIETQVETPITKESFIPKYNSPIIDIIPENLLTEENINNNNITCLGMYPKILTEDNSNDYDQIIPITNVMKNIKNNKKLTNQLFFMLNGENQGLFIPWDSQSTSFECIYEAAYTAALALGADTDWLDNGIQLYSQLGYRILNLNDLLYKYNGIAHILLTGQLWIYPGIEKGYIYHIENNITLTTISLQPKVLDVKNFLTKEEANLIMENGLPTLNRSRVADPIKESSVSTSRTSHTAFLADNTLTRTFRTRSTKLARLPSPSCGERLQLVRYQEGEFYRQHFDTFHKKDFLPKNYEKYSYNDYLIWLNWTSNKIISLKNKDYIDKIFQINGSLYPDTNNKNIFEKNLLKEFWLWGNTSNFFVANFDSEWNDWIINNINNSTISNLMEILLQKDNKSNYLPYIIKVWENKIKKAMFKYTFPKNEILNGVTIYYHWIRSMKDKIGNMLNNGKKDKIPPRILPTGDLYPKYDYHYQNILLNYILNEYTSQFIKHQTNNEWYEWIIRNRNHRDVLLQVMQHFYTMTELVIKTWENKVIINGYNKLNSTKNELKSIQTYFHYNYPKFIPHFIPQRYVTLFIYLNNVQEGGETVFPFSKDRLVKDIERKGMEECSKGLAVPAKGLHASLFYVQNANLESDPFSRHGGCPPDKGIKWGSNSFMWNADADEGADAWKTG